MGKWAVYSKTIWLNIIVTAIAVFELLANQEWIAANPALVAAFGAVVAVLNIVLRFWTDQPIQLSNPNKPRSRFPMLLLPLGGLAFIVGATAGLAFGDEGALPERPSLETSIFGSVAVQEVQEDVPAERAEALAANSENFRRALIKAAVEQVRDGKMRRGELLKLRVAMMSPAFRQQAEDLVVVQMSASGSESDKFKLTETGAIDRASIDWDKLLAFLKEFIPLLLELINALSDSGEPIDGYAINEPAMRGSTGPAHSGGCFFISA